MQIVRDGETYQELAREGRERSGASVLHPTQSPSASLPSPQRSRFPAVPVIVRDLGRNGDTEKLHDAKMRQEGREGWQEKAAQRKIKSKADKDKSR